MVKVNRYKRDADEKGVIYSKDLWYDVSNQVFYDKNDGIFGVGIVRNGVACLRD